MTDQEWLANLPAMSAAELETAQRMLESQRRHPAFRSNAGAMFVAGERLRDIKREFERRFRAAVSHFK